MLSLRKVNFSSYQDRCRTHHSDLLIRTGLSLSALDYRMKPMACVFLLTTQHKRCYGRNLHTLRIWAKTLHQSLTNFAQPTHIAHANLSLIFLLHTLKMIHMPRVLPRGFLLNYLNNPLRNTILTITIIMMLMLMMEIMANTWMTVTRLIKLKQAVTTSQIDVMHILVFTHLSRAITTKFLLLTNMR